MQAITLPRYGPPSVLQLREIPDPVIGPNQLLVRTEASSVNALDWRIMRGDPGLVKLAFGWPKPRIKVMGADVAGVVEAVGADVREFSVGDEVYADVTIKGYGGFSELAAVPEKHAALRPECSWEAAGSVPIAGLTAVQGLRDFAQLRSGESILIHGVGGVGSFAVQCALAMGAKVTAVCSPGKVAWIEALGGTAIDYTLHDFRSQAARYDVFFDCAATRPIAQQKQVLAAGGRYVFIGGKTPQLWEAMLAGKRRAKPFAFCGKSAVASGSDLQILTEWINQGAVTPLLDKSYRLSEVPAAISYMEQGHVRGKIPVRIG